MIKFSDRSGEAMISDLMMFVHQTFSPIAIALSWLDNKQPTQVTRTIGIDKKFSQDYMQRGKSLDPFISHLRPGNEFGSVIEMSKCNTGHDLIRYRSFLDDHSFHDEIDLFFFHKNSPFVILAVLGNMEFRFESEWMAGFHKFVSRFLELHPNSRQKRRRSVLEDDFELTHREMDVVELILAGASNRDIAERLGIGLATTKTHVARALDKVGVRSRSELSAVASQI